jgi:predicted secreted acid phosphatase
MEKITENSLKEQALKHSEVMAEILKSINNSEYNIEYIIDKTPFGNTEWRKWIFEIKLSKPE